jgi:hypothetical protein
MTNCFFCVILSIMWLGCCEISMCYDDEMLSPVQILEETILVSDVTLNNSSKIYADIANLFDQAGAVKSRSSDVKSGKICLAWMSNPSADKQAYKMTLQKDTSICDAIRQISKRRKEVFANERNYVVIRPSNALSICASYQGKSTGNKSDLALQINAVMLTRISLLEPAGELMEEFVNAKLQESGAIFHKDNKDTLPFIFKMDKWAKSEASKVNIIGTWTYRDLLDAICALTGLQWRIEGKTLWLEKTEK